MIHCTQSCIVLYLVCLFWKLVTIHTFLLGAMDILIILSSDFVTFQYLFVFHSLHVWLQMLLHKEKKYSKFCCILFCVFLKHLLNDSCLRFVGMEKKTLFLIRSFEKTKIMQKLDSLPTLHALMLIINGCLNNKTLQSANTQVTSWSLLSRKPLVIVYGLLMKSLVRHLQQMREWNYPQIHVYGVTCDRLDYCRFQSSFVSYLS